MEFKGRIICVRIYFLRIECVLCLVSDVVKNELVMYSKDLRYVILVINSKV